MAKNRYRVTDEKIDLILRLKHTCNSERIIAKAVDLSQGTVNKILNAKYLDIEKTRQKTKSKFFNWGDYENSVL
jgi:uncharacterized membrane protein YdbT with pleckstrin-like domain